MDDAVFIFPLEAPDISSFDGLFATMFGAVQTGDVEGLKAIKFAASVQFKEHLRLNGGLLLFEAVRMGLYTLGEFLLANGCSLRMCKGMNSSALHLAAYDLNAVDFLDTLARYSANCVDIQDLKHNTPLHVASACNNVRGLQTLLSHGADVYKENSKRQCPLDLALAAGHVECVQVLLQQFETPRDVPFSCQNLDLNNYHSFYSILNLLHTRTQMDVAAKSVFDVLGHKNVVQALDVFHCWDKPQATVVLERLKSVGEGLSEDISSAVRCRLQCIDLLIEKGFKFNMLHLSLKILSHDHYLQAMRILVEEYKFSVNSNDSLNYTPLHFAVERSSYEGVKYLLDQGALVNVPLAGMSPLEVALQKPFSNESIVRLLVERGAETNFFRRDGWCPLKAVLELHNEPLAQFLVDWGADVDLMNPGTGLTIFFEFLFMPGSNHYNTRAMRFLLEHGASLVYEGADATPLHLVASVQTSRDPGGADFMKLLIEHSSDINALDFDGNTPLIKAVKVPFHSPQIIRLLLESGADPNVRNLSGQTALDLAITLRKVDVISLLMEFCVEYNPNVLFSKKTVLLDAIIINMPYNRDELFRMRAFLTRLDIDLERRCIVEKFIDVSKESDPEHFEDIFVCLYELLYRSPIERSCISAITSGAAVLFAEVEHHVLKTKLSGPVNESQLRGVLEYRLVVNERDTYKSACDREIEAINTHVVFPGVTLSYVLSANERQLMLLSRKSGFRQALSKCVSRVNPEADVMERFPIFGVTLSFIIHDILAKMNLMSAAAVFMNRYVARLRERASEFKSLPQHIIDNILGFLPKKDLINTIFLENNIKPKSVERLRKRWKVRLVEFLNMTSNNKVQVFIRYSPLPST